MVSRPGRDLVFERAVWYILDLRSMHVLAEGLVRMVLVHVLLRGDEVEVLAQA